jgi:hypothetical protein
MLSIDSLQIVLEAIESNWKVELDYSALKIECGNSSAVELLGCDPQVPHFPLGANFACTVRVWTSGRCVPG